MVASLVTLVVYLIIVGLVFYLLLYLIDSTSVVAVATPIKSQTAERVDQRRVTPSDCLNRAVPPTAPAALRPWRPAIKLNASFGT